MAKIKHSYSNIITAWFGKYKGVVYAVSLSKDAIKNYFELHRKLRPDQYDIYEEDILESDLILRYEDQVLVEWEGYFIPSVDVNLIESNNWSLIERMEDTIKNLKDFATVGLDVKKITDDELESIITTIKVLQRFISKPKIINKMVRLDMIDKSILFADMSEYNSALFNYQEQINGYNKWYF